LRTKTPVEEVSYRDVQCRLHVAIKKWAAHFDETPREALYWFSLRPTSGMALQLLGLKNNSLYQKAFDELLQSENFPCPPRLQKKKPRRTSRQVGVQ
jgi:hypothetical protein